MRDGIYRDTSEPVRAEVSRRLGERRRDTEAARRLRPLYARRAGRIAGGAVAAAVAFAMFALAVTRNVAPLPQAVRWDGLLTMLLYTAAPAGLVAYGVVRPLAAWRFDRALATLDERGAGMPAAEEDPFSALGWLEEAAMPGAETRDAIGRLEVASVALPLVACSLIVPLALHGIVAGLGGLLTPAGRSDFGGWLTPGFDEWIAISAVVVGHAHVVLAVCAVRFARRARRMDSRLIPQDAGLMSLLWAVLASAVPGALLLFVPPVLAFFTGLAFIPLMFKWARAVIVRERMMLADAAELASAAA